MEVDEERQRMEDFVRDLFSKTKDFNLLTKKIVRKQYLQHSNRTSLNSEQKTLLTDVIIKLLFEFNVGKDKSADEDDRNTEMKDTTSSKASETTVLPENTSTMEISDSAREKSGSGAQNGSELPKEAGSVDDVDDDDDDCDGDGSCEINGDAANCKAGAKDDQNIGTDRKNDVSLESDAKSVDNVKSSEDNYGDVKDEVDLETDAVKEDEDDVSGGGSDGNLQDAVHGSSKMMSKTIGMSHSRRNIRVIAKPTQKELTSVQQSGKKKSSLIVAETSIVLPDADADVSCNDDRNDLKVSEEKECQISSSLKPCTEDKSGKLVMVPNSKRLSAFEVLQSVFEDSSDAVTSLHSDEDVEQETDESVVKNVSRIRNTPFSLLSSDSQEVTAEKNNVMKEMGTPVRSRPYKASLESGNVSSDSAFTPPAKLKKLIQVSDSSESNNSPIRIRLFRNRIINSTLGNVKSKKAKKIITSDSDSKSPFKVENIEESDPESPVLNTSRMKWSSGQALKSGQSKNQATACDNNRTQKTVKPFKISLSKKEILKDSDSDSDSSSDLNRKTIRRKRRKLSDSQDEQPQQLVSSASSSHSEFESDDLKLSQIKLLYSQNQKRSSSSDSDEDLLINYAAGGAKHHLASKESSNKSCGKSGQGGCAFTSKVKIIREKGLYSSDSENPASRSLNAGKEGADNSIYTMRIIRENVPVNSESDNALQNDLPTCDTAATTMTTKGDDRMDDDKLSPKASAEVKDSDEGDSKNGCNGQEEEDTDSDTSSLSSSLSSSSNMSCTKKNTSTKKVSAKVTTDSVEESSQVKLFRRICRAAELFVNYKKEFQDLKTNKQKCKRLREILRDAGMTGRPTLKAAERIRLLREAKQLNKDNIISCDSGRSRRKRKGFFSVENSPAKIVKSKPESFHNLKGIVDSEGSGSDTET
ncbi:protein starmaker [Octopus bimaculoides]|uniref:Histone chaperone domain-containing protein n=1 Tax=Octopus bimaculoides TaxID=37653 RepID=A0A0L8HDR9_OCTBM|nr:protein starmaker [Octopus bimaculoides]|eukprot:XP_014773260.1 PREDICTED: protein starmaker-like [Octopus bimaculoides]